jgi:hypothetical protein
MPSTADIITQSVSSWPLINNHVSRWKVFTSSFFTAMAVCSICGILQFGDTSVRSKLPHTLVPTADASGTPFAMANMMLHDLTVDGNKAHVCHGCRAQTSTHIVYPHMLPLHTEQYTKAILAAHPAHVMLMSVLDLGLSFTSRMQGFSQGQMVQTVFDGALVAFGATPDPSSFPQDLRNVLALNIFNNPVLQQYVSMIEQPMSHYPIPILPGTAVRQILHNYAARGPTNTLLGGVDVMPVTLSTFVANNPAFTLPMQGSFRIDKFICHAGSLTQRGTGTSVPYNVLASGEEFLPTSDTCVPSIEAGIFPYLFPHGTGLFAAPLINYCNYLRFRMKQGFTLWTLYKPFLLVMFQIRQAHILANKCSSVFLEADLVKYRAKHPNCTDDEALKHLLRYSVPPDVAGSPAWHSRNLKDLLHMVSEFGMPSFFLTLTADEASPLKWDEIHDLEHFLHRFNASFTYKDAPVECTRHFVARVQAFMRDFLMDNAKSAKLLGRITHSLTRYECQGRGSLHSHIILWCHADDLEATANEIVAAIPGEHNASTNRFDPPTDPTLLQLYNLVVNKHMHVCTDAGCRHNSHNCKYGYPFNAQYSRSNTYDVSSKRWCYYRPGPQHRNVVSYHPSILLLWGAHCNIQRITNDAWSRYVLKYTLKCEPHGVLNMNPDVAAALGMQNLSPTQLKVIASMYCARPVFPCEAAMSLLQIPIIDKDVSIQTVNSFLPAHRCRSSTKARTITLAPVDKYVARPDSLDAITFTDYFKQYEISKTEKPNADLVGSDTTGAYIYKRAHPASVRYTDYHPGNQPEGFFYNVLLGKVPFRLERSLLSAENLHDSYYVECFLRGIVSDVDDVDELLDAYCQRQLYDAENRAHMLNLIETNRANSTFDPTMLNFPEHIGDDADLPVPTAADVHANPRHDFAHDIANAVLTDEQQVVFNAIMAQPYGVHVISGCPGSGKTFLTKYITHHLQLQSKRVLLSATTGAAATRLGASATTAHTAFALPYKGTLRPLHATNPAYQLLQCTDVYELDEYSMLTCHVLNFIMLRMQQSTPTYMPISHLLRHKLIILVGDGAQLPPVCKCRVPDNTICEKCHITSSSYFANATKHVLKASVRHASDPEYVAFLDLIRHMKPTQDEINAVLAQCVVADAAELTTYMTPSTTILSTHVAPVRLFNDLVLDAFFAASDIHVLPMNTNASSHPDLVEWVADSDFHCCPRAAVGAKVLLMSNLDLSVGAANGAAGTITDFIYVNGALKYIIVLIALTGKTIKVSRHSIAYTYHDGQRFYKSTFPLHLSYAITGHKAQGATISDTCLIHIQEAFAPGLVYVMLSRVTNRSCLRLFRMLTPDDFVPIPGRFLS